MSPAASEKSAGGAGASPVIPLKAAASANPQGEAESALFEVRKKIYPRAVSGWFATLRWAAVWFTQIIFYGLPWIAWNDRQAVLFDLGAPNLTDKVWLHGGSLAAISEQIDKGRNNLMPAHKEFLGPERSRILAGYVWSLSQAPAAAK